MNICTSELETVYFLRLSVFLNHNAKQIDKLQVAWSHKAKRRTFYVIGLITNLLVGTHFHVMCYIQIIIFLLKNFVETLNYIRQNILNTLRLASFIYSLLRSLAMKQKVY